MTVRSIRLSNRIWNAFTIFFILSFRNWRNNWEYAVLIFHARQIPSHLIRRLKTKHVNTAFQYSLYKTKQLNIRVFPLFIFFCQYFCFVVKMAALKYGDLSNQASKDYIFDIERFASFEGNTGPYILYTIVRIKSLVGRYEEEGGVLSSDSRLMPLTIHY